MTITTVDFTAAVDTNLDTFGGWAYMLGSGGAMLVDATNDRVQVTGFAGSDVRARYTGAGTTTADQEVTLQVNVKTFNNAGILTRCAAGADTCYAAIIEPAQANQLRIYRIVAGVATLLASAAVTITAPGVNSIRFKTTGSGATVALEAAVNGSAALTYADTDAARLTSGHPGVHGTTDENFTWFDTFVVDTLAAAGTLNPAPASLVYTGGTPTLSYNTYTWYTLPAPGAYDSNSILAGQTYPAGSLIREATTPFANVTVNYALGLLANDINDYAVADPGFTGSNSITYEIKTPLGATSQFTVTLQIQQGNITLSPATASRVFTTSTPTLTLGGNVTLSPATASLSITPGTPTLSISSGNKTLNPSAASISITPGTPTLSLSNNLRLTPAAASITMSPGTPTLVATGNITLSPTPATLRILPSTPVLSVGGVIQYGGGGRVMDQRSMTSKRHTRSGLLPSFKYL